MIRTSMCAIKVFLIALITTVQCQAHTIALGATTTAQYNTIAIQHNNNPPSSIRVTNNTIQAKFYTPTTQIITSKDFHKVAKLLPSSTDNKTVNIQIRDKYLYHTITKGEKQTVINIKKLKSINDDIPTKKSIKSASAPITIQVSNSKIHDPLSKIYMAIFAIGKDLLILSPAGKAETIKKYMKLQCSQLHNIKCPEIEALLVKNKAGARLQDIFLTPRLFTNTKLEATLEEIYDQYKLHIPESFKIGNIYFQGQQIQVLMTKTPTLHLRQQYSTKLFHTLHSVQGIAIVLHSEKLHTHKEENVFSIFKYKIDSPTQQNLGSMLPWYHEGEFNKQKHVIEAAIKSSKEKDKYKIRLSTLYFSKGMYHEAASVLSEIVQNNKYNLDTPTIFSHAVILQLLGDKKNAKTSMQKVLSRFEGETLPKEVRLWGNHILNLEDNCVEFLTDCEEFTSEYHEEVLWHLIFHTLEKYLDKNKLKDCEMLLSKVKTSTTKEIQEKLKCYKARLELKKGNIQQAKAILIQLEKNAVLSPNGMQIGLLLAQLHDIERSLPTEDIANNLVSCKMRAGDIKTETKLCLYLADIYKRQNNLVQELRILKQVKTLNQDNVISKRLRNSFNKVFLSEQYLSSFSNIEKANLFLEFKNIIPSGEQGDKIALSIIKNLVQLDLLDKAEKILEHQIKYRTFQEKRSLLSEYLACIYIYNNKPDLAISILNFTEANNLPTWYQYRKRSQIKALACMRMRDYRAAIRYVNHDTSQEGRMIKQEAAFRAKEWKMYADMVTPGVLSIITKNKNSLSEKEIQNLIKLALCYSILGNKQGINMICTYAAAANKAMHDTIKNLTSTINTKVTNIDHYLKYSTIDNLLDNYLKEIEANIFQDNILS
ncbi:tetratricopeptide repeat protein [Candidatus Sneabacter namystus]|uniref:Tetratricopeptide repeat protein n=1 Tax=Candidatus Sneabacter namystus TaxID=2601646 RepID=A0A5C0UJL5_9RICK|nr:hypothetical protein [Candidatus Sneabacter namystus]QEK39801.1 hypothetical protein FZC37_02600 [Candidatus Sneabacter namystus]